MYHGQTLQNLCVPSNLKNAKETFVYRGIRQNAKETKCETLWDAQVLAQPAQHRFILQGRLVMGGDQTISPGTHDVLRVLLRIYRRTFHPEREYGLHVC